MTRAPCSARAAALLLLAAACRTSRGPAQDAVDVAFEGQASFGEKELREVVDPELASIERRASRRAAVDDAAFALERFYRSEGFAACRVDWTLAEDASRPAATFQIAEGPRTRIERVRFRGNRRLSEDELVEALEPSLGRGLARGRALFVESALEEGLDDLAGLYRERGYLDVRLQGPRVQLSEDGTAATVHVSLEEGPRYVLRALRLEGGSAEIAAEFRKGEPPGRPLSPRLQQALRGRLKELYGRRGYPDVEVAPGELRPLEGGRSGEVELVFDVRPRERVTVSGVRIAGNRRTRPERIRSALSIQPGQVWDAADERESFRELYRSGLFSRIDLRLEPESGPERVLVVEVEEAPSRELYVEPGYGSYERLRLAAGWREKNLFGSGRMFDAKGALSEKARLASLSLSDRRFLDEPLQATLAVFAEEREEPSFTSAGRGASLGFKRRLSDRLEGTLSYQFKRSEVSDADLTDPAVQDLLDDVDLSSITLGGNWDARDDLFAPARGFQSRGSLEYGTEALGSELNFLRVRFAQSLFRPLAERTVLALSWRGGAIAPVEGDDLIPVQERFFNGGENTVRSFEESEIGPQDKGEPIGGEGYHVLTAELRRRFGKRWEVAAFWDAGNLVEDAGNYLELDGFRHALGLGLRYHLPVGPIRLDWAVNPDPRDVQEIDPLTNPGQEDEWVLHFSIGMSF